MAVFYIYASAKCDFCTKLLTKANYLEVDLAGEKGYFKADYASYLPVLYDIHQYNQPTRRQDTLFLHIEGDDYRLFLR